MATKDITSVNSLETRDLQQIWDFYNKFNERVVLVGERSISADWNTTDSQALLNKTFDAYGFMGAYIALWGLGQNWGDYNMAPYDWSGSALTPTNNAGTAAEALMSTYPNQFGANISGLEFGGASLANSQAYYDAVYGKGYRFVRIPFKWHRVQPTLNGALDATETNKLKSEVTFARNAGFTKIIIDMHDYGQHNGSTIGGGTVTEAHFQNAWERISGETGLNESDIEYDIMNEPTNISGGASGWQSVAENLKSHLDGLSVTNKIWIESYNWAGVQDATAHPTTFAFNSVHDYPEYNNDGLGSGTYASNNTSASGDGHVASKQFTFDNTNIPGEGGGGAPSGVIAKGKKSPFPAFVRSVR